MNRPQFNISLLALIGMVVFVFWMIATQEPCYPLIEKAKIQTVFHSGDSFGGEETWRGHALKENGVLVEYKTYKPVYEGQILEAKRGCSYMNQPF